MTYHDFLNAGTFFPKFMKIKLIARDNENRNIYTSWIVFKLKKTIELSIYSWCQIVYNLFWVWKKEGHLLEGKVESTGGECDKEISRIIGIFIKLPPFFSAGQNQDKVICREWRNTYYSGIVVIWNWLFVLLWLIVLSFKAFISQNCQIFWNLFSLWS